MNAQQLKNSILQEAIEGRLVPQDPNDEPASVLLDKIRKEKEKLVKKGKLKKKDLQEIPISEEEIPFKIPENWEWCRLFFLTYNHGQKTPSDTFSYIDISSIDNNQQKLFCNEKIIEAKNAPSRARKIVKEGDVIYATVRPYLHNMCIIDKNFTKEPIVSTGFAVLSCIKGLYNKFLFYYLLSPTFDSYANDRNNAKGIAYPAINDKKLYNGLVPLPPLAEQHRIVEKIEELMPKVEEYGKAQEALDKLNTELPEQLKKSILQEAIEGRLVPQDPNDEPASVLLDKIRKEKEQLVKEGKLKKKDLQEIPISEEEIPFKIPKSWEIVRLGEITYNHGQKKPNGDFSYIDIGSIDNKQQKLNNIENIIKEKDAPSRARKIIKYDDVIYATVRPYLHNICIIDKKFSKEPIASTGFAVLSCIKGLYNKFLFYYLISPIFDAYANDGDNAKGMAYPAINDKKLYSGIVPLPPLAEQHRIVEKIEELLRKIEILKENK